MTAPYEQRRKQCKFILCFQGSSFQSLNFTVPYSLFANILAEDMRVYKTTSGSTLRKTYDNTNVPDFQRDMETAVEGFAVADPIDEEQRGEGREPLEDAV